MPLDLETLSDVIALAVNEAVAPFKAQLAVTEAKLADFVGLQSAVTGLRERIVVVETKAGALVPVDVSPLRERLSELESKGQSFARAEDVNALALRVSAVESKPAPVAAVEPSDVDALRERVVAVETKAAVLEARVAEPHALGPVLERTERTVAELSKDLGAVRERVAVAEVRQLTPGPAGKDGRDGVDGADGLGFEDMDVEFDGDRTITIKAERGTRTKSWPITLPYQYQRGVFVEGTSYVKGDLVTWGGSQWHANETTSAKPGEGSKAWTLVVKRGRDGKDGKDAPGAPPVVRVS